MKEKKVADAKAASAAIEKQITGMGEKESVAAQAGLGDKGATKPKPAAAAQLDSIASMFPQVDAEEWTSEDEFYAEVSQDETEEPAEQALAQVDAEAEVSPNPVVQLTPSVHVQVTRVGYE